MATRKKRAAPARTRKPRSPARVRTKRRKARSHHHPELWGLGLVAVGLVLATVLWLGWDGAPIHDAVAVAHLLRPGLVETKLRNVEVERVSELCRGRTVVDLWLRTGRPANAHVGVDLDTDSFFDLLVERIQRLG
jgi:hypothetical protein